MNESLFAAIKELLETRHQMARSGMDPGPLDEIARQRLQELQSKELSLLHYQTEAIVSKLPEFQERRRKGEQHPLAEVPETVRQLIHQARKHNIGIFFEGTTFTAEQFESWTTRQSSQLWPKLNAQKGRTKGGRDVIVLRRSSDVPLQPPREKEFHEKAMEEELERWLTLPPIDEQES